VKFSLIKLGLVSHKKHQETKSLAGWLGIVRTVHENRTPEEKHLGDMQWRAGKIATAGLIFSLLFSIPGWGRKIDCGGIVGIIKKLQVLVLVAWTLLPPVWFWYEYIFLFRKAHPNAGSEKLDELKTQQDLSSKIWIATASVLLILYFWKDIGGGR
jgi:hypothetical protein